MATEGTALEEYTTTAVVPIGIPAIDVVAEISERFCVDQEKLQYWATHIKKEFFERIQAGDKVIIAHHHDGDGIASATLAYLLLKQFGILEDQIEFWEGRLDTDDFEAAVEGYEHVIAVDLFYPDTPEKRNSLFNVLSKSNVLMIDHHDDKIQRIRAGEEQTDDPIALPEMFNKYVKAAHRLEIGTRITGNFLYISPSALGVEIPSIRYTPAIMLSALARVYGVELPLFPMYVSIVADYAKGAWANSLNAYKGDQDKLRRLAFMLNHTGNLDPEEQREVIAALSQASTAEVVFAQDLPACSKLETLQEKTGEIADMISSHLQEHPVANGEIVFCFLDREMVKIRLNGKPTYPTMLTPVANLLTIGEKSPAHKITLVLAQFVVIDGRIYLRLTARDDRYDYNVAEIMTPLGGGGHPNAAGVLIEVREVDPSDVLRRTTRTLEEWGRPLRRISLS